MTTRTHDMPFGAQTAPDGVRFRLWAPSAPDVSLVLNDGPARLMRDAGEGWRQLLVEDAKAGDAYAFLLPSGLKIPDPASRAQAADGRSLVVDPAAYRWGDGAWRGRPWEEAVLYEAHVGAATERGDYTAFADRLERIAEVGVTAIELLPLAHAPGARNWGYDGVLHFAPNAAYGPPEALKALIDRAHALGVMVLIDVVYNHFGPSGNYLHAYAERFFTERHQTPWGAGLNFDDEGREHVRAFFTHNALYWLQEFNADGLRFDAVHAIRDDSERHILAEIAETVRRETPGRHVHLVLENEHNEARWLERENGRPRLYTAQWNDDAHHCWHTLLTGESEGYYANFADAPVRRLARALAEGFVYQGETGAHGDKPRGEASAHLHPTAFIDFLQNHDQVGNRALGERIDVLADPRKLAVARAALLLSPHVPMLFMGEEWGARSPFLFFVDFSEDPDLAQAVRDGRRREFAAFTAFGAQEPPDPTAPETFHASRLDWEEARVGACATILAATRDLLAKRRRHVTPLLAGAFHGADCGGDIPRGLVDVTWRFEAGALRLVVNVGDADCEAPARANAETVHATAGATVADGVVRLPAWSALMTTEPRA